MKILVLFSFLIPTFCNAQKTTAEDRIVIDNLKRHINYLANDKLEGRRTGSNGEQLAYLYIQKQLVKNNISTPPNSKSYLQSFTVSEGKFIQSSKLKINGKSLIINEEYFPLAYSGYAYATGTAGEIYATHNVQELITANSSSPHFDLYEALYNLAKEDEKAGKAAVFFTCPTGTKQDLKFDKNDKYQSLEIPVVVLTDYDDNFEKASIQIDCEIDIANKTKFGHNVISYINNNAANTIILGAHYDHLGFGEDHNSLYTGTIPMVHNGADDNASGTAALIEIGKWLKKSSYKKYNYLLVNFSGEELGLYGSKYFTEHAGIDLKTVNYMINMDMVGRLNDTTHGVTIGGYGTSPTWGKIIKKEDKYFKINIDSSGTGPSDHTSFYKKDIPVLFFFTGSHKDYHKPTDDAEKINYYGELQIIKYIQNVIAQTNDMPKVAFTKTREVSMGKSSFKVSLGIMPDYTYTGVGVLVDGVSDNKPAQKAGIKVGDVLVQLGEYKFNDVQSYMGALNKFDKGQTANVKVKRGKEELIIPISF